MEGIIYCIRDVSSGEIIYVGSTTLQLCKRCAVHLHKCFKDNIDYPVYKRIRETTDREGFYDHFTFEELYSGEFDDREALRMKEKEYIEEIKPSCNKNSAFVTDDERDEYQVKYRAEWYKNNKDYFKEWNKKNPNYRNEWYHKNIDHMRKYMREYMRAYNAKKRAMKEQQENSSCDIK